MSSTDPRAPAPPPDSWASKADARRRHLVDPNGRPAPSGNCRRPTTDTARTLYYFAGSGLRVGGREVPAKSAVRLRGGTSVALTSGATETELLLLLRDARSASPSCKHGPFVMNQRSEIEQAVRGLSAHSVRGLAVAEERSGPRARQRPLRAARRRPRRTRLTLTFSNRALLQPAEPRPFLSKPPQRSVKKHDHGSKRVHGGRALGAGSAA